MKLMNKRIATGVVFIGVSLILLLTSILVSFEYKINQAILLDKPALLTIDKGMSVNKLAAMLEDKKWLTSRFWLKNYPKIFNQYAHIKAGTYQIQPHTQLKALLTQLNQGKEFQFAITFVEGSTFKQWLAQLKQQPYLQHNISDKSVAEIARLLAIKETNPEGLFFPDTYAYTAGTDELTLLKRAYKKMQTHLQQAWQQRAPNLPYQSPYQALIMASIIEKETSKVAEQPLIASVFINRLSKNMRLQTDPTVIYGLGERYHGDIKRIHLKEKTPYNTYKIKGLPPTPIAMPGSSAIYASLHPTRSEYLYFVSQGNGYHVFSKTLREHNKAVNELIKKQRALLH